MTLCLPDHSKCDCYNKQSTSMNDTDKSELEKLLDEFEDAVWCSRSESVTQSTAASIRAVEASKAIKSLFTQQCNQARIDEVERAERYVFKLRTNVPRLRVTPPQMDEYYRMRKIELAQAKETEES